MTEGNKRIWRYYLSNQVVGKASVLREDWLKGLCLKLRSYRALVVRRSLAYYDAGCPMDLCESSAARDLWNALQGVENGNE